MNAVKYPIPLLRKYLLVLAVSCLVFIWPLPETMAVRYFFMVIGFSLAVGVIANNMNLMLSKHAYPIWIQISVFFWLLVHLLLFSHNFSEQLYELTGMWMRCFFCMVIGVGLGLLLLSEGKEKPSLENIVILGFLGTPAIFFVRYCYEVLVTGEWLHLNFYMTPFLGKTPAVIFGGLLLPLLYIKIIQAVKKEASHLWTWVSVAGISLMLFQSYFSNAKNAMLFFAFVSVMFLFNMVAKGLPAVANKKRWKIIFLVISFLLVFTWVVKGHIEANPDAWRAPIADIRVGIDIEKYPHWKDKERYDLPKNEYGIYVSPTVYLRAAWVAAGLDLIIDNPLGYGLVHHSFGLLARQKWDDFKTIYESGKTRGSTHSGWLDIALGIGIPGILLILLPLAISFLRAFSAQGLFYTYIRWAVPSIFIFYLTAEVAVDYFIEFLFFLIAFFSALTCSSDTDQRSILAR